MFRNKHSNSIEPLEARIAPAAVYPTIAQAEAMPNGSGFVTAQIGTPVLVHAGQVLTTGVGPQSGSYLLFVQQGEALVFVTDLNNNGVVDPNEITGIAAGNGLRMISFVDIHGDIVTDLNPNGTLSDSAHNASLSNPALGGDGRILLDNTISMVEFRSLVPSDLTPGENINLRYALTSYSLYGNIFAGGGFGSPDGGLIIDNSQAATVAAALNASSPTFMNSGEPSIGGIYTGTAAGGQFFSFGLNRGDNLHPAGQLAPFVPAPGEKGGDILNVGAPISATAAPTKFNIGVIEAGNGGIGAAGGSIINPTINGSTAGGYILIAGNGGDGPVGGAGGSILNYSDLGSVTGAVTIQSGNGGIGTTGVGGAGGTVTLGTADVSGGITIQLGNGGNGFTAGGAGASLPTGSITPPDFAVPANATFVLTTMHAPGSIGTTIPIDFNGDGFGDVVYGTQNPDTLVILFGDGSGGFSQRMVLPIPETDIVAATVGDFLGNGHLGIAAVSGTTTTDPGVVVFIPNVSKTGQFLGFDAPRWSPLPDLFSGDPTQKPFTTYNFLHANAVPTQIVSGDFSGSGHTELAVSATYYSLSLTNVLTESQVVVFLQADLVNGQPDGEFYANFGTTAGNGKAANPLTPFGIIPLGSTAAYIEATALSTTSNHDVVVTDNTGTTGDLTGFLTIFDNSDPSVGGPAASLADLGSVDTNRNTGGNNINLTPAWAGKFTILDFGGAANGGPDGNADIAMLTSTPAGYMIVLEGDGANDWNIVSGNPLGTGDNQGVFFGNKGFGLPGTKQVSIVAANLNGPNANAVSYDDVAILDYDFANAIVVLGFQPVDQFNALYNTGNPGATELAVEYGSAFLLGQVATIKAYDAYTPVLAHPENVDMLVAMPYTGLPVVSSVQPVNLESLDLLVPNFIGDDLIPEATNFIHVTAGNGGDGLVGAGGIGGSLGKTLAVETIKSTFTTVGAGGATVTTTTSAQDLVGSLNITLPGDLTFNGNVTFTAGSGGDGFTNGGAGGSISGVTVAYGGGNAVSGTGLNATVSTALTAFDVVHLIAGDGGSGVSGSGGNGGSLTANSIDFGELFQAGDGGTGAFGGNGGSIIGNQKTGYFDSLDVTMTLIAGQGADGVKSGGNGGSILNFHASFNFPNSGAAAGDFQILAGAGGDASSGPGGNGGSILNDSPLTSASNPGNYMAGDVDIEAGKGGNGLSGGNGGAISNFVDQPSNDLTPAVLTFIGGDAGNGVSGPGGHGGSITNVNVPSTGQASGSVLVTPLTPYLYDRVLAGNGGTSAGNDGGDGGSVTSVITSNTSGGLVVNAGAGGTGLYAGGAGGSILHDFLQLGGVGGGPESGTKLVAIAGKGGDATAWVPDPFNTEISDQAQKAFGGRVGQAGNGGSINDFHQTGGTFVNVDLIAGNGGDTLNYGTVSDLKFFVGKGGSVSNVHVAGEIGNIDSTTPLKSYNDVEHGQTLAQFVEANFRDNPNPGSSVLTDALGSVGIIVGAAGRLQAAFTGFDSNNDPLYETQPASGGVNGSLITVQAGSGIESAVAGSIDRIATITVVQDVSGGTGLVGVSKVPITAPGYLSADGDPLFTPVVGGALINGALITNSPPTARAANGSEQQDFPPGNVFVLH